MIKTLKKLTIIQNIAFVAIGLTALAAMEVAWISRKLICPKCGGDEFSEYKPGLLTCRACGHALAIGAGSLKAQDYRWAGDEGQGPFAAPPTVPIRIEGSSPPLSWNSPTDGSYQGYGDRPRNVNDDGSYRWV